MFEFVVFEQWCSNCSMLDGWYFTHNYFLTQVYLPFVSVYRLLGWIIVLNNSAKQFCKAINDWNVIMFDSVFGYKMKWNEMKCMKKVPAKIDQFYIVIIFI